MPRVTTHTASNRGKTYTCTGCGQPIEPGQAYYRWVRRIGPKAGYRRHVACGPPRPTELSSRKTAQVEEAVGDYSAPALPELDGDATELDASPWEDAVSAVTDAAESVADEYESGVSNMPDQLQYAPTGEAMTAVAEELREWATELRDKASEGITLDLPDRDEETDEEWSELVQQAAQDAWDERESDLQDLMGSMPEYQG